MILLDTHVLIWMSSEPKKLSKRAQAAIRSAREADRENSGIAVAAMTLWELAWLAQAGRLQFAGSVDSYVREAVSRVVVKPLTPEIASLAALMPADFPKDLADRMIVATAATEGMALVTADERIRDSGRVTVIW